MKVVLRCSHLEYENIKNLEYIDNIITIHCVDGRVFKYNITKKIGSYIIITDDGIEYIYNEGIPHE